MTGLLPVIEWVKQGRFRCQKTPYSKREAQTAMNKRMASRRNRPENGLRIYECPDCLCWHITHKEHYDAET